LDVSIKVLSFNSNSQELKVKAMTPRPPHLIISSTRWAHDLTGQKIIRCERPSEYL